MSIRRVQVIWSGAPTVGGGLSTIYFDSTVGTAQQCVTAVGNFFTNTNDRRLTTAVWNTVPEVATLSDTGVLEDIVTTTPSSGQGTDAGDAMPPTVQGLLQVRTASIVNGRQLRGRIFLPGNGESQNAVGIPTAATLTDYNTEATALINDANTSWVVWSRTHGLKGTVSQSSMWTKWAVLRSRRD
jgi:hypothetical protein